MAKVDRCLTQTEIDSPLKGTYHYRSTSPIVCLDSSSNRDAGGQKEVSFSAVYTIIAIGTFQLHRVFCLFSKIKRLHLKYFQGALSNFGRLFHFV